MKIAFLSFFIFAAVWPAAAEARDMRERAGIFREMMRAQAPVTDAAGLKAALDNASKIYDEWLPADYGEALSLQSRDTWTQMTDWYKFSSQELHWLAKEAARLEKACKTMSAHGPAVKMSALKTAASARRFLGFIDKAAWGEGLRKPMMGDMRAAQVEAVKRWERTAACASK